MAGFGPIFPHRRVEKEVDEELEFHIERRTLDNIASGMPRGAAREEALRRFGDMGSIRRACRRIGMQRVRAERRAQMIDEFRRDMAYALRSLVKRPGFAVVVILTLALGIGGTTAIFSVVDAVVLRPLPFEDPDRLVLLRGVETGLKSGSSGTSFPDYVDLKEGQNSFAAMAAWSTWQLTVTGSDLEPTLVPTAWVSHDLFATFGVRPAIGRGFLPEEDRIGGEPVVILSDGFWASRFASDPKILGRTMLLDGGEYTVVGIMPSDFDLRAELLVPMEPRIAENSRGVHNLSVVARLKPGVSREQAERDVKAIAARLEETYPDWNTGRSAALQFIHEAVVGNVRPALLTLLGAVGVVLLIVCANVANLLLARATSRQKEIAIRTALGAGRSRMLRQLLTESLVLALLGGVAALLLAHGGIGLLKSISPGNIPRLDGVGIDSRVLGFAFLVTMFTGVIFGIVPAVQASSANLQSSLKEGGRTSTQGGRRPRLRQLLVVTEMALAVVLVVGAGLFINSFLQLQRVDSGFAGKNVLVAPLALPTSSYPFSEPHRAIAFYSELMERIEALPGVESAAVGYRHPLDGGWETSFQIAGLLEVPQGERPEARIRPVRPGYFKTLGMPLLKGRDVTDRDDGRAPGVVIINESFARAFFPDDDPIGHRLIRGSWWPDFPSEWEIIGVVADVKMDGLTQPTPWAMYYSHSQWPFLDMNLVVRTAGDPLALTAAIRDQVWAIDADVPVENMQTLDEIRAGSVAPQRFQTMMLGIFAALALTLAAVGIYGVLAYSVAQRTSEIGVRISLGARGADVLRLVVGQGMKLALIGLTLGLLGALAVTRLIASLLFDVSATDLTTFASVAVMLTLVALAACTVPAWRASRVDPVIALRAE